MYNTIILKKGYARLTESEYKNFQKGDTIYGVDSEPEELKRWGIEDEEQAKEELAKYRCTYIESNGWDIEEYALEYCECDSEGEFISGSDYELAEKEDFDFDTIDMDYKKETAVLLYGEGNDDEEGELIQRFSTKNLVNILIDYESKILHAEHANGKIYDIPFYKMTII